MSDESFRDSIGTISDEGKRQWVYPKKPSGVFWKYRKWVSYFLLIILFASPFIKINGNQFLLFNVLDRKFNIFGFPFWPQDFYLVVISMIIGVVFITLFTVAFGRIFCGWICPQTIFMEMVYRRIEFAIEGDRNKQMKLNRMPWNKEKILKKGSKWTIFYLIAFLIANVFLAYLIGSDDLLLYIQEGPQAHMATFVPLVLFSLAFFFIFSWFREQVCVIACPYGRLQGVLLDNKSIVVAYDHKRGEKENGRKKFRKNEDREALGYGDCIDCMQCVHVCPTGIDIRNGTQLECVNCTACIDECDTIMEKINLPKGLIRYASEDNITKKAKFKYTPRLKAYTAVLTVLVVILISLLFMRSNVEADVRRLPGNLYQTTEEGLYRNVYSYKVVNKTTEPIDSLNFKLLSHKGTIKVVTGDYFNVEKADLADGTLLIDIAPSEIEQELTTLKIGVYKGDELIEQTKTNFMGPRSFY